MTRETAEKISEKVWERAISRRTMPTEAELAKIRAAYAAARQTEK